MKVLFIRPAFSGIYKVFKETKSPKLVLPSTGILYLASYLKKHGHRVFLIDNEVKNYSIEELLREIERIEPAVIGFGPTTPEFFNCIEIVRIIKKSFKAKIVFGASHVSALPEETLKDYPEIDFVIRGEGEITMLEFLNALENGNSDYAGIKGLSFRRDEQIIYNEGRPFIDDIDTLPWPDRDLMAPEDYLYSVPKKGMRPFGTILTGRGCPYNCSYCYSFFNSRRMRVRNPVDIVDEIEYCVKKYKHEYFVFLDESFSYKKEHVFKICEEMINRKISIPWWCMTRANLVTQEIVSIMKKAGCHMISLGVESGDQGILNKVEKKLLLEDFERAFKIIKDIGIETRGSFIIGFPFETLETVRKTIDFSKRLKIDRANFNIMTPLPGTEIYNQALKEEGIKLLTSDWREFTRWGNAVIETPSLKPDQMKALQKQAITEFYCRPRIIWNHLLHFIQGERDFFYYRPLLFALSNYLKFLLIRLKGKN